MKRPSFGMTVNTKDQKLLIFLLMIVVAFICYYFVISPSFEKGKILNQEALTLKNDIVFTENLVASLPELRVKETQQKQVLLKKYQQFFYELNGERLLYKIDTLMLASGVKVTAYSPSTQTASPIIIEKMDYKSLAFPLLDLAVKSNPALIKEKPLDSAVSENPAPSDNPNPDQIPLDSVANMDIALQFADAGYPNVIAFIKSIEILDKTIIVKNININKSAGGTGLSGEVILSLYAMPKVSDEEAAYLEFKPVIPLGKLNPFQ